MASRTSESASSSVLPPSRCSSATKSGVWLPSRSAARSRISARRPAIASTALARGSDRAARAALGVAIANAPPIAARSVGLTYVGGRRRLRSAGASGAEAAEWFAVAMASSVALDAADGDSRPVELRRLRAIEWMAAASGDRWRDWLSASAGRRSSDDIRRTASSERVHERGVGAVLQQAAHQIRQRIFVRRPRRVDRHGQRPARPGRKAPRPCRADAGIRILAPRFRPCAAPRPRYGRCVWRIAEKSASRQQRLAQAR